MTDISTTAREAAREASGRFGEQVHTVPETSLGPTLGPDQVNAAWETRKAAARALDAAAVNVVAARMPENLRGIRYIVRDGQLVPALFIPASPGGHVAGAGDFQDALMSVTALAQGRSDFVELEPVTEASGNMAWEWVPTIEQRLMPVAFAELSHQDARRIFREADSAYQEEAVSYLRAGMPEGVESIEVTYGPVLTDGGHAAETTVVGAYGSDGELVMFNVHDRAFADYRVNVARTDIAGHFAVHYSETGAPIFTITREP